MRTVESATKFIKSFLLVSTGLLVATSILTAQAASNKYQELVDKDIKSFRSFYEKKFSNVEFSDFNNGVYAIDPDTREQWLEIEEFPPYELAVDDGESLYQAAFANGKSYADCFGEGGTNVRQNYPHFDEKTKQVITLELAINQCREANGEKPLAYNDGEIAIISAYIAFNSRDQVFDIKVDSKDAYNAYQKGKKFFYSKRGQLNFSCADCHMKAAGLKLRADVVGPALGHPTSSPIHRSAWGELGTLHKRYRECNRNVRAQPFPAQSEEYRNVEYYQTVMSNGLTVNGPSTRK